MFIDAVLPGPEEALPPVEPKFTAIWRKHTATSNVIEIPLFSGLFLMLTC
jgi:hypothetical protein